VRHSPAVKMSSTVDDSEDVNDFLQRIKELGDKRDKEDEERNRKLEEEILQGRKERQARRAGMFAKGTLRVKMGGTQARAGRCVTAHLASVYLANSLAYRTRQIHISNKIFSSGYTYHH